MNTPEKRERSQENPNTGRMPDQWRVMSKACSASPKTNQ